jgi:glycosyltransferase involved in cell wall biosynthesis
LKILFVTSLYSPLETSIREDKWNPTGMPAIAKLFEGLRNRGIYFDSVMINQRFNTEAGIHKYINSHFGNTFLLVCTKDAKHISKYMLLKNMWNLSKTIRHFQLIRKLLNDKKYNLIYVDRSNTVIAWFISLFYDIPVFIRYHGIVLLHKHASSLKYKFLHPIRYLSFFGNYAYILCSKDGSPVEAFLNRFRRNKVKYSIMLNGIDKSELSNEKDRHLLLKELNIRGDIPILLFVGRLTNDKGIRPFLESIRNIHHSSKGFHVIIIGDGELKKWAENFISDNQLGSVITLLGQIGHDQIPKYLSIGDLYVSLNYYGNLSNTVLEALGAGLATIVLKSDGHGYSATSADVLGDSVLYIDRNHTVRDLEDIINKLLCNSMLTAEYKNRAKRSAQEKLPSWDERIAQEIKLMMEAAKFTEH